MSRWEQSLLGSKSGPCCGCGRLVSSISARFSDNMGEGSEFAGKIFKFKDVADGLARWLLTWKRQSLKSLLWSWLAGGKKSNKWMISSLRQPLLENELVHSTHSYAPIGEIFSTQNKGISITWIRLIQVIQRSTLPSYMQGNLSNLLELIQMQGVYC